VMASNRYSYNKDRKRSLSTNSCRRIQRQSDENELRVSFTVCIIK
jgi:hypothetical protein